MNNEINQNYWIVLLLGSYDKKTVELLYKLKENISSHFMNFHDTILIFLLDNIRFYIADIKDNNNIQQKIRIITELFDENKKISLYMLTENFILDVEDLNIESENNIEDTIRKHMEEKYTLENIFRPPILEELKFIAGISNTVFILRNDELTRGGEYIELVYLLDRNILNPNKTFFLKREGFDLSQMVLEILDSHNFQYRTYRNEDSLFNEVNRIIYNEIKIGI